MGTKRQRAEAGECSEFLGSVDRIKGRTTCSASPAPDTSSGNTGAAPLQTADYLQREVFRHSRSRGTCRGGYGLSWTG